MQLLQDASVPVVRPDADPPAAQPAEPGLQPERWRFHLVVRIGLHECLLNRGQYPSGLSGDAGCGRQRRDAVGQHPRDVKPDRAPRSSPGARSTRRNAVQSAHGAAACVHRHTEWPVSPTTTTWAPGIAVATGLRVGGGSARSSAPLRISVGTAGSGAGAVVRPDAFEYGQPLHSRAPLRSDRAAESNGANVFAGIAPSHAVNSGGARRRVGALPGEGEVPHSAAT